MKSRSFLGILCGLALLPVLMMAGNSVAKDKKSKPTVCSNPHPEQLCSAANTCGSSGSPCVLEIRRAGGNGASVNPNVENFPKGGVVCIATGTSVTWQGGGKNTGIVVDFGDNSPFEPSGTILGGSDRPVKLVAMKAGCFSYSAGACTPGTIYGMCGNSDFNMIVTSTSK